MIWALSAFLFFRVVHVFILERQLTEFGNAILYYANLLFLYRTGKKSDEELKY